MIMLGIWQGTGDSKYQGPLQKSLEATYARSELEEDVNNLQEVIRKKAPVIVAIAPVGYSLIIKKHMSFTSSKFSAFSNTVTSYNYDNNSKSGSVILTWHY